MIQLPPDKKAVQRIAAFLKYASADEKGNAAKKAEAAKALRALGLSIRHARKEAAK